MIIKRLKLHITIFKRILIGLVTVPNISCFNRVYIPGNDCMNNFENGHFLAKVAGQTTTIKGASIGYECFKDYKATDSKEYTCLADGQWNTDTNLLCRS